jgi:hypothetical protein
MATGCYLNYLAVPWCILTTTFARRREENMSDWIVADPEILAGKPCIKGTRISVEFILELLASGATLVVAERREEVVRVRVR